MCVSGCVGTSKKESIIRWKIRITATDLTIILQKQGQNTLYQSVNCVYELSYISFSILTIYTSEVK